MKLIDLSGQRFGKLTVIKDSGKRVNHKVMWLCQCDCGNQIEVSGDNLKSGNTKSCGCLRKEKSSKNLVGQRFGHLVALEKTEERYYKNAVWLCQCDCGCKTKVPASYLLKGNTTSCGCLTSSFGSMAIQNWLLKNNIPFQKEYSFNNLYGLKNGKLRFDFAIFDTNNNLKLLIEYQGEQHYRHRENFGVPEEHDEFKRKYCQEHHIPLLEISYRDEDKIDKILKENLVEEI